MREKLLNLCSTFYYMGVEDGQRGFWLQEEEYLVKDRSGKAVDDLIEEIENFVMKG